MRPRLRRNVSLPASPQRWTIGFQVSSSCRRLEASLLFASSRGTDLQVEVVGSINHPLPNEVVTLFRQVSNGADGLGLPKQIVSLRTQLAEAQASLVSDLLTETGVASTRILAIGVHDPGFWCRGDNSAWAYLGLCDAARLAEQTGLNVIDAFPARDLVKGGLGGPVHALAQWILLRHDHHSRLLLDLGQTIRMSYVPASRILRASARVISFEVGPGMKMLDLLAYRLTEGQSRFDPGGRLAAQGRRLPELIQHWLADPYFERPLPRWHPQGVRPERFLTDAVQMAVHADWTVRDLLCSATHFIAETVAHAIHRRLPDDIGIDEIVVTGGGEQNGMLLREVASRLQDISVVRIGELGFDPLTFDAAAIGVLSLLHLDQIPGNSTMITGTEIPRVLGRLTPGSPQNWRRLLQQIAGTESTVRPLRSAL